MGENCLVHDMRHALTEEYVKFEQIFNLSNEQFELTQSDSPNYERIALLMDQKMTLLGELQRIEKSHESIKLEWERHYRNVPPAERIPVAEIRDKTINLLERLHSLETGIQSNIKRLEEKINEQFNKLHQGRAASKAYFSREQSGPRFIDKKK